MELSDRKKKILQIVVDDYIDTAVPVSSKSITEKYMSNVSSATIRSELSALEELGFLSQPHTSAGRVPSAEAYKLYVNELMVKDDLTVEELDYIKEAFNQKTQNIESVLKNATKVISELTSYTSVAVAPHDGTDKIINLKLFRFKQDKALVIIVTETKLLKDNYIDVPPQMTDEQLNDAGDILERMFTGRTVEEITLMSPEIEDNFLGYKNVFLNVIEALKEYIRNNEDIVLEGEDKILDHPEYSDVGKIKNFLSVVTSKDKVIKLLDDNGKDIEINVKVGSDGYDDVPEDCSLISATYNVNGKKLGTYGVIGPSRMDYQKVIAVLENVGKILENILSNR